VAAKQYISSLLIEREPSGCCPSVKGEAAPAGLLLLLPRGGSSIKPRCRLWFPRHKAPLSLDAFVFLVCRPDVTWVLARHFSLRSEKGTSLASRSRSFLAGLGSQSMSLIWYLSRARHA
jgi:hypothetical protein